MKIIRVMENFKVHDWIGLILCICAISFVITFVVSGVLDYWERNQKEQTSISYIVKIQNSKVTVEQVDRNDY